MRHKEPKSTSRPAMAREANGLAPKRPNLTSHNRTLGISPRYPDDINQIFAIILRSQDLRRATEGAEVSSMSNDNRNAESAERQLSILTDALLDLAKIENTKRQPTRMAIIQLLAAVGDLDGMDPSLLRVAEDVTPAASVPVCDSSLGETNGTPRSNSAGPSAAELELERVRGLARLRKARERQRKRGGPPPPPPLPAEEILAQRRAQATKRQAARRAALRATQTELHQPSREERPQADDKPRTPKSHHGKMRDAANRDHA